MAHQSVSSNRARLLLTLGLMLATASACKSDKVVEKKCRTQTECSGGFKCVLEGGGPPMNPQEVGTCKPDRCALKVPCTKEPKDPGCLKGETRLCDLHDSTDFCECDVRTNQQPIPVTTGTPTTG